MAIKTGLKNIQAAAYNGARMAFENIFMLTHLDHLVGRVVWYQYDPKIAEIP